MENRESVVRKVTLYVESQFNGDWQKAFNFYAIDGKVSTSALHHLLEDAKVGYAISRPLIESMIMTVMDANGDKYISWDEFQTLAHIVLPPKL